MRVHPKFLVGLAPDCGASAYLFFGPERGAPVCRLTGEPLKTPAFGCSASIISAASTRARSAFNNPPSSNSDEIGWLNDIVFGVAQLSNYDPDMLGGDMLRALKNHNGFFCSMTKTASHAGRGFHLFGGAEPPYAGGCG